MGISSYIDSSKMLKDRYAKKTIRILALVEADTVSGPVKNLLAFGRICNSISDILPLELALAPIQRIERQPSKTNLANEFLEAAVKSRLPVHAVTERFRFDPELISRLKILVKDVDPDIIQTHFSKSHFLVRVSGVWKKRPWIAFHHGHTRSALRLHIYQGLDRWSLRAPNKVVAVSEAFERQLLSFGVKRDRIVVIHNAVERQSRNTDVDYLRGQREYLRLSPEDRVIVAVGRLSKEKAFPDLVVAVDRVRKLQPQWKLKLIIIGEGSERQNIEQTIRAMAMQDNAVLTGHVQDVSRYYEIADLLAISSTTEGSPNVLLEGMAAGVPIVTTAVGGIPEIVVDHEHALLVRPGDHAAMANAISLLLSDLSLSQELARRARERILECYSPQQRARRLTSMYHEVYENWQLG
jgi:glycosyltransferase involved in cell wall biosynthesis